MDTNDYAKAKRINKNKNLRCAEYVRGAGGADVRGEKVRIEEDARNVLEVEDDDMFFFKNKSGTKK